MGPQYTMGGKVWSVQTPFAENDATDIWERFSKPVRGAMLIAQEEAHKLGEENVSTEHLKVGILLESIRSTKHLLREIAAKAAQGDEQAEQAIHLTSGAYRAVELAREEASRQNCYYINIAHMHSGLNQETYELTGSVLPDWKAELEAALEEFQQLQDNESGTTAPIQPE